MTTLTNARIHTLDERGTVADTLVVREGRVAFVGRRSDINAAAGEPAIANGAIVPLTTDPSFNISLIYGTAVSGGTAHVILDVTGYFQ